MTELTRDDAEEYTQALGQVVAGGWRQVALGKRLGVPDALGITVDEWVRVRLGGYIRLSIPERREAVAELTEEGMSAREIGEVLGVADKTVVRDRNGGTNVPPDLDDGVGDAKQRSTTGTNVPAVEEKTAAPEPTQPLVVPLDGELLEAQQRQTLIDGLERAIRALDLPASHARAEAARLLADGGGARTLTPNRFERVAAFAGAFADELRKAGVDG